MRLAERVGQHLRRLRAARGLSQARLAEHAGLTPELVSRIERGAKEPRLSTLERLAVALDVDPSVLFALDSSARLTPHRLAVAAHDPELAKAAEQACLILERAARRVARRAVSKTRSSRD